MPELTTIGFDADDTLWHHERFLLLQRMNQGDLDGVEQEMARLRARAERFRFQASREILSLDFGRLLLRTADVREFGSSVPNSATGQQPSESIFSAWSSSGWPDT